MKKKSEMLFLDLDLNINDLTVNKWTKSQQIWKVHSAITEMVKTIFSYKVKPTMIWDKRICFWTILKRMIRNIVFQVGTVLTAEELGYGHGRILNYEAEKCMLLEERKRILTWLDNATSVRAPEYLYSLTSTN